MSLSLTGTVTGWESVMTGVKGMENELIQAIRDNLPEFGLLLEIYLKSYAPVDTGRLRASIGHPDASLMVRYNPKFNPQEAIFEVTDNSVTVGTSVIYARKVEMDNPWMQYAMDRAIDDVRRLVNEASRRTIRSLFRRGGKVGRLRRGLSKAYGEVYAGIRARER